MSKKLEKIIIYSIIFICLGSFAVMKPDPHPIDVFGLALTITSLVFINKKLFEERE